MCVGSPKVEQPKMIAPAAPPAMRNQVEVTGEAEDMATRKKRLEFQQQDSQEKMFLGNRADSTESNKLGSGSKRSDLRLKYGIR